MTDPTRRDFFKSVAVAAALGATASPEADVRAQADGTATSAPPSDSMAVVAKHKAVFTKPPVHIPYQFAVDAPLLGNGDMLAAFAGAPEYPQFWVTLNDFWELKNECWLMGSVENVYTPSGNGQGGPRPVGRVIFEVPSLAGASYRVEQDLATATTEARFEKNGTALMMRSWVAATENLLVIELTATGEPLDSTLVFNFPDEPGAGVTEFAPLGGLDVHPLQEKGLDNGVLWATRTYHDGVDLPTKAALAAHYVDAEGVTAQATNRGPRLITRLEPGRTITLVVAMRSWFKHLAPFEAARGRAEWMRRDDVQGLRELHLAWWRRYWNVSHIEVDDPVIEKRYYVQLYGMGSLSRDPDFPPDIFGFESWDRPTWCGDHKIDYNYEMSFAGMYVSGHLEQAAPYEAPLLAAMDNAHEMARRLPIGRRGGPEATPSHDPEVKNGHRGVHYAIGLGPKGHTPENGAWGAKNQNAFALMPMIWRWNLTHDLDYAWKVYPLVRDVASFWEDDLFFENGRYVIKDTTAEDANANAINPANAIAFVRATMRFAIDLSDALGVDQPRQDKWRDILAHMSPLPTKRADQLTIQGWLAERFPEHRGKVVADLFPAGTGSGKVVFIAQEQGADFPDRFLEYIIPSGELGLDSDPQLLDIAHNTIEAQILLGSPWRDFNLDCIFFPACVRVGYDPEVIWRELHNEIVEIGCPNGFRTENPHGLEKLNLVPSTLHEMMLLSHENVLRFFRVWPRKSHPNARFQDLWAYGAFGVSATLKDGVVGDVRIVSVKGRDCAVENPWPGKAVALTRNGNRAETLRGTRVTFGTHPGEHITISPA
jgi:hypothetical protein